MTKEYRKRFEAIFHDCSSMSELFLKMDINHINYPEDIWHRMKYIGKILTTFHHSRDLRNDYVSWIEKHADEVTTPVLVSQWIVDSIYNRSNTPLNKKLLHVYLEKNGVKLVEKQCKKIKRKLRKERKS